MLFLILAPDDTNKLAVRTSEYYGRALVLMSKQFLVRQDLLTTLVLMDTSKLYFAKQVTRHSIYPIKLTLVAAIGASVWVLLKPMSLAVSTKRLLTVFAFNWIFKDVVTNSTNKLSQESLDVLRIINFVLFKYILLIMSLLVNYTFHFQFNTPFPWAIYLLIYLN